MEPEAQIFLRSRNQAILELRGSSRNSFWPSFKGVPVSPGWGPRNASYEAGTLSNLLTLLLAVPSKEPTLWELLSKCQVSECLSSNRY